MAFTNDDDARASASASNSLFFSTASPPTTTPKGPLSGACENGGGVQEAVREAAPSPFRRRSAPSPGFRVPPGVPPKKSVKPSNKRPFHVTPLIEGIT